LGCYQLRFNLGLLLAQAFDHTLEDGDSLEDEFVLGHLPGGDLLLAHDVGPVPADSRENVAGHPILEGPGLRLV